MTGGGRTTRVVFHTLLVAVGACVLWATVPGVERAFDGNQLLTPVWSVSVIAANTTVIVGVILTRRTVETIATVASGILLIFYALALIGFILTGDANRAAYSVIAIALAVPPVSRAVHLLRDTGRRRE